MDALLDLPFNEIDSIDTRIITSTQRRIVYVPEIKKQLNLSLKSSILLSQLEYRFISHPNGFYKFMAPCQHEYYRKGDSWEEELGFTSHEVRTGFDEIGVRYRSKKQLMNIIEQNESSDPFQGKLYLSYLDIKRNITYYIRNHQLADQILNEIHSSNQKELNNHDIDQHHDRDKNNSSSEMKKFNLQKLNSFTSRNQKCKSHTLYTEITTKITAAEKAVESDVEKQIAQSESQKQLPKAVSPDMKPQLESQPDTKLLQTSQPHAHLQPQPGNPKEQPLVKLNAIAAAENKNNKILPFQKSDALISDVLTEHQTRQVRALVREVQADFQQHMPQELEEGITIDLLSPTTYTQAGNLFAKKFNTIRKQIRKGAWSMPAEMISHQQQMTQQFQIDTEINMREVRGDIVHWESCLKLAKAKGESEQIELCQEILKRSVEKFRRLENKYQQIANA